MEAEEISEEEMIDSLFFRCDVQGEGKVEIGTIIQFLENSLGNGHHEPDLVELRDILESSSLGGKISLMDYRNGVKHWIADIRQRCESTSFLQSEGLMMNDDSGDSSSSAFSEGFCGCIEISDMGDGPYRNEQDFDNLLSQVEDLKFQNNKLVEEVNKLRQLLESQEETASALTSEIQVRTRDGEQLKKKVRSLQELVDYQQVVIEENEELKNKMSGLKAKKKELESKLSTLERENVNLQNQTRNLENKKSTELAELKEKYQELVETYQKLEEERDHMKTGLADTEDQLQRAQDKLKQFEIEEEEEASLSYEKEIHNETNKTCPKPEFHTPLTKHSIYMELKDRLDENRHLPSPLCEKLEISKDLSLFSKPAVLPAYMSAWELDVTNGSVRDYSLELIKSLRGCKTGQYEVDMEKKLLGLEHLDKDALQKEIMKLYRLNWDLAEKCHKAEVREGELREMVNLDKEKFQQLEESLQTSQLAREIDLKDLWRLVQVEENEYLDNQSDVSEFGSSQHGSSQLGSSQLGSCQFGSSQFLKRQIFQEIETLKNKLHKRKVALGALSCKRKVTFARRCTGTSSNSSLLDALGIDLPENEKQVKHKLPTDSQTFCRDCQRQHKRHPIHCIRSVPVKRRKNRVHDAKPNLDLSSSSTTSGIVDLEVNNSNAFLVNGRKIPVIILPGGDSDTQTSQCSESNKSDDETSLTPMKRNTDVDSIELRIAKTPRSFGNSEFNRDKAGMVGGEIEDFNLLGHVDSDGHVLRRPSYTNAIDNETCSVEDVHIPRSRSYSFQTAIEQGQISPNRPPETLFASSNADRTPANDTGEPSWNGDSSWNGVPPKFSSTPLPCLKPPEKTVAFHPHTVKPYSARQKTSVPQGDKKDIVKDRDKLEIDETDRQDCNFDRMKLSQDKDPSQSISMSFQAELAKSEGVDEDKSPCMGKNLSVLLEEDVHGVSVSSTQNSPSSSTAGAQPTQHVSSFLGFSEPMSAEVWTLSRSSARQIDSGHSSSLTNSSSCQQQKQSKGSDITESSFLDSDISKSGVEYSVEPSKKPTDLDLHCFQKLDQKASESDQEMPQSQTILLHSEEETQNTNSHRKQEEEKKTNNSRSLSPKVSSKHPPTPTKNWRLSSRSLPARLTASTTSNTSSESIRPSAPPKTLDIPSSLTGPEKHKFTPAVTLSNSSKHTLSVCHSLDSQTPLKHSESSPKCSDLINSSSSSNIVESKGCSDPSTLSGLQQQKESKSSSPLTASISSKSSTSSKSKPTSASKSLDLSKSSCSLNPSVSTMSPALSNTSNLPKSSDSPKPQSLPKSSDPSKSPSLKSSDSPNPTSLPKSSDPSKSPSLKSSDSPNPTSLPKSSDPSKSSSLKSSNSPKPPSLPKSSESSTPSSLPVLSNSPKPLNPGKTSDTPKVSGAPMSSDLSKTSNPPNLYHSLKSPDSPKCSESSILSIQDDFPFMDEIELPLTVDHLEAPLVKPTALHTVEFSSAQKESTPEKIANLTASFSSMSIATSPKCVLNSTNGGNSPTTQNGPLLKKSSLKKVHIAATDKSDNDEKSSTKKEEKGKPHTLLKDNNVPHLRGNSGHVQEMVKDAPVPSNNAPVPSNNKMSLGSSGSWSKFSSMSSRMSSNGSTSSDNMSSFANNNYKASRPSQMIIEEEEDYVLKDDQKTDDNLSKLRESHLARRRDQLRSKMPELSEIAEKDHALLNGHGESNEKLEVLQPPSPNEDPVMPSVPDDFLRKLGLPQDGPGSDDLSDQEIESKFTSLSLAFKTDSQTLEKRLEIQERSRDIAEQNVDKELQGLRTGLATLNQICTDVEVREVLTKIQNNIDILEKSTARVSSRAEVLGAIQQEKRMSKAVEIMVHHVENLRRVHEREHAELEEARKLLQDSRSLGPSTIDIAGNERMLSRRSASVCPNSLIGGQSSRRRVSEIALPKVLGGIGAPNLHPSSSMDSINSSVEPIPRTPSPIRADNSIDEEDEDAKSRFQAAVASTAFKSTVANTLRRASLERQNPVQQTPTSTPEMSRDNSQDKMVDVQEKEKQKNLEEEAFKKGYEQGMRASLGQDLSGLREQQNQINQNLGDIMDSIENQTEEPKSLKQILLARADSLVPKVKISGWRIRMTFGCFFVVMAILSVIVSLFPIGSATLIGLRHYGKPAV